MTENTSVENTAPVTETQAVVVAPETTQPEATEGSEATVEDNAQTPKWVEKRLSQMAAQKRELRAQLDATRDELRALSERVPQPQAKPIEKNQYANEAEYIQAIAEQKAREIIEAERNRERENNQARTVGEGLQRAWVAQVAEVKDYAEVIASAEENGLQIPGEFISALKDSPDRPKVAYYLSKNPEAAERLFSLPPSALNREVVRLEIKAEAFWETAKSATVVAKPTAQTMPKLNGRPASAAPSIDKLAGDDYLKEYRKQLEAAKKR